MIPVEAVWTSLATARGEAIIVTSMTSFRNWHNYSHAQALDLPNTVMGKGSSIGLGVALARPERRVIVLDGDGSLLMNLGTLVTIANAAPKNLLHLVFQNGIYEVTGGQPVPGAGQVDLAEVARGAGIPRSYTLTDLVAWEAALPELLTQDGPIFAVLHVTKAAGGWAPSPPRKTYQAFRDLRAHLLRRRDGGTAGRREGGIATGWAPCPALSLSRDRTRREHVWYRSAWNGRPPQAGWWRGRGSTS